MKSPFYFIVEPYNGRRYDNVKDWGGIDFITSSSKEDHTVSNRFARVIETPLGYNGDIKKGDLLVVHHNVFKYYNDMKGRERSGKSFLKDNTFFVDNEQFFLYGSEGNWKTHGKYCFVKPVELKQEYLHVAASKQPLVGIVTYTNSELENLGVKQGDKITFTPNSEYEYTIDGEKMYRMFTQNIVAKWM